MLMRELLVINEGQMKNAIMDTVEDHCRNTDIPSGTSYADAVKLIVKSIRNTDTMAAECPVAELTEYVKSYFDPEDLKEGVDDSEFPKQIGKAGEFSVELNEDEKVSLMKGNQEIVSMPLIIWKNLTR